MSDENKIKAWITWPDGSREGWYHCNLLLENGWPIYGHMCSTPGFAYGDLWATRQDRKDEWAKAGLELEIVAKVPYSQVPSHVMENNKNEAYVGWAEKHFGSLKKRDDQPRVEIEMVED